MFAKSSRRVDDNPSSATVRPSNPPAGALSSSSIFEVQNPAASNCGVRKTGGVGALPTTLHLDHSQGSSLEGRYPCSQF